MKFNVRLDEDLNPNHFELMYIDGGRQWQALQHTADTMVSVKNVNPWWQKKDSWSVLPWKRTIVIVKSRIIFVTGV